MKTLRFSDVDERSGYIDGMVTFQPQAQSEASIQDRVIAVTSTAGIIGMRTHIIGIVPGGSKSFFDVPFGTSLPAFARSAGAYLAIFTRAPPKTGCSDREIINAAYIFFNDETGKPKSDCDQWTNGPNSSPCLHGGVCIEGAPFDGKFTCNCSGLSYFRGQNCERPAEDCEVEARGPNGKGCGYGECIDSISHDFRFSCDCTGSNMSGENCDRIISDCTWAAYGPGQSGCLNGGQCLDRAPLDSSYVCNCAGTGHSGKNCEVPIVNVNVSTARSGGEVGSSNPFLIALSASVGSVILIGVFLYTRHAAQQPKKDLERQHSYQAQEYGAAEYHVQPLPGNLLRPTPFAPVDKNRHYYPPADNLIDISRTWR